MGNWQLDPYHTQVEFSAKHLGMMTVRGYFDEVSTTATIDPAHPENATVEATISTASIRTNNGTTERTSGLASTPSWTAGWSSARRSRSPSKANSSSRRRLSRPRPADKAGSGAGRALDEDAITMAVVASIRHQDTGYDGLLMSGMPRDAARDRVRGAIDLVLDAWRDPRPTSPTR